MHLSPIEIILAIFLCLVFLLQILYWFYFHFKIAFYKVKDTTPINALIPVSIIICAKNEAENLKIFLPKIFAQDYPQFEVVVVNDCSYDHTEQVLKDFAEQYPQLKIVTIPEDENYKHGKKLALTIGIKGAQHEYLLMTDADCYPTSDQWLKQMAHTFTEKKQIILSYGKYETLPGILNRLIRYDTFTIAINYLSYALRGKTYMGVGRNLAYKKTLFFENKGFANHYHIPSGDDDLFISEVANSENVAVQLSSEAFTASVPKTTWADWMQQKARHLSTANFYKKSTQFLLVSQYLLSYLFYIGLIFSLFFPSLFLLSAVLLLFRSSILLFIHFSASKVLKEHGIWYYSIIFEVSFLCIYPIMHLKKRFEKPNKWKN
jgi:poly-beta-1,6-N-acetyl-D-glucosamine synthase